MVTVNILQCTGKPYKAKDYLTQTSVNEAEKPGTSRRLLYLGSGTGEWPQGGTLS